MTVATPSGPPLDQATIEELRRLQIEYDNPAFIQELVAIFKTNAPSRMLTLREAIERRDRNGLEHLAHTLKSNCGMLGAARMATYCAELEQAGEQGNFDRAAALLADAEAEFARVLEAVENLGPEPGPGTRDPGSGKTGR